MKTENLIFEIGGEELPPKALDQLTESLFNSIKAGLEKAGMRFDKEQSRYFASPRRMAVCFSQLENKQADRKVERKGPAVQAAFDGEGNPTKAAMGFARSCGVEISDLGRQKTDKGEWLAFSQQEKGQEIGELLPNIIQHALDKLPIPKRMRWGNREQSFIRPVHWILCLYGEEIIPMQFFGHESSNKTRGHRIHHPGWVTVKHADEYQQNLLSSFVLVDQVKRKQSIIKQANEQAELQQGKAIIDTGVLTEVCNLTEWPVAVSGSFDQDFLRVPQECLISSMEEHQKMFPVVDKENKLMPVFIGFANIESLNPKEVIKGFEKVIRPRLADAAFFWDQDRKTKLKDRNKVLKGMVFQKKLGSIADKCQRVAYLMEQMAEVQETNKQQAEIVSGLYKCDLATDMVYEFTDLQGIMGRYYALEDGYDNKIAQAIEEHYLPKFAGDKIPASALGKQLALCDRLDTIAGIFAAGLKPTGNKDPFALRRAALGILRIIIEGNLDISLSEWFDKVGSQLPVTVNWNEDVKVEVIDFIHERLRGIYLDKGFTHGQFDAVMDANPDSPVDFVQRIKACREFSQLEAAQPLAAANKRIANILKKMSGELSGEPEQKLFEEQAEKDLSQTLQSIIPQVEQASKKRDYLQILQDLSELKEPVDAFFDQVMVMADNELVRINRLKLLQQLRTQFLRVADISKL